MEQAQAPVDPLRRVWIPIERKTVNGTPTFKTMDGEMYCRAPDGSIRSIAKKMNGKLARKQRSQRRFHMGSSGSDPRPDQHDRPHPSPDPPDNSKTHPAPGGVGTGTADDPAKHPDQSNTPHVVKK